VAGWVLGESIPAVSVELVQFDPMVETDRVLQRLPLRPRPDVAAAFPCSSAASCGFETAIPLHGPTAELTLTVRAVLRDGARIALGTIRAKQCWRELEDGTGGELVSVVIPCYNQAHFLPDALQSVLAQSHSQVEVVVVDDGSDDNTAQVAARYPGVRCIRQPNQGLAAARNTGLRCSNGRYLVFLDADDRLLPDALATGLACLRAHPACAFAAGHYRLIDADGIKVTHVQPPRIRGDYYLTLLRRNFIMPPAVVIYRRAVFEVARGFNTLVSPTADYELYLRIAQQFPICYHGQTVAEYRQHGTNMTRNPELMLTAAHKVLRAQWTSVRKSRRHRKALRANWRYMQRGFGESLADQVRASFIKGDWRRTGLGVFALLRYYPLGLKSVMRPWLESSQTSGEKAHRSETFEIVEVEPAGPDERLIGWGFDLPKTGTRADGPSLDIAGWVLARSAPVVAAEVNEGATVLERVTPQPRPDVAAAFPAQPGAEQSGFQATVSVRGRATELVLGVHAVLADESRVPLGTIRARRVR
jgi:glycosyltransferase involved in cell wall biosynthesis